MTKRSTKKLKPPYESKSIESPLGEGFDRDILQQQILMMAYKAREGHIPSALSILDILRVEFGLVIPSQLAKGFPADRFVLSKGHGSLALYAALWAAGELSNDALESFCQPGGLLGGHPDSTLVRGVEASTGSLGHGLPIAVGMCAALKIDGEKQRVVTLVGDGELNEGSNWEAALIAAQLNLDNLVCIVDDNQSTSKNMNVLPIVEKFEAFRWSAQVIDGHDDSEIFQALMSPPTDNKPHAVIARTIKGNGVKQMTNAPEWHHRAPDESELMSLMPSYKP